MVWSQKQRKKVKVNIFFDKKVIEVKLNYKSIKKSFDFINASCLRIKSNINPFNERTSIIFLKIDFDLS